MVEEDRLTLGVLRCFTVPKYEGAANEDRWCCSEDGAVCAISDGATVSFDSGPWAEILTRRFLSDQDIEPRWLSSAVEEYDASHDRDTMPWPQQAAYDGGSFATLLAVNCHEGGVRVFAFGDSILAFVDGFDLLRSIPYMSPDEFDQAPRLLSTNRAENRGLVDDIPFAWHDLITSSYQAPALLLMTDALGRWLLEQPDAARVRTLLGIFDEAEFQSFVDEERGEGRLKRDDTTLVVLGLRHPASAIPGSALGADVDP